MLSRSTLSLFFIALTAVLQGCAVNHSTASDIYYANTWERIPDKTSNEEHARDSDFLRDSVILAGGVLETQGLGLQYGNLAGSIASVLLDSLHDSPQDFPSVIAWVPKTEAPEPEMAIELLSGELNTSFLAAAKDLGWTVELIKEIDENNNGTEGFTYRSYGVAYPETGCNSFDEPGKATCKIAIRAGNLNLEEAPEEIGEYQGWRTVFLGSRGTHIRFFYAGESFLPTVELYQRMSETLPEWLYFFMPLSPKYVVTDKEGSLRTYPYLLNRGEELHFVEPK